jgi:hypothetical protein
MKRLLIILLVAPCFAQTQGNVPQITDVYSDGSLFATIGAVTMGDPVVTGDKLIAAVRSTLSTPYSISDTLVNSWTCTTPLNTPAPSAGQYVYFCYADASSSGAGYVITACPANQCEVTGHASRRSL